MSRYTYFAWSDHLGLMKIGTTTRPAKRMVTLPGSPRLVALITSEELPECFALEDFAAARKHGEWFDISEADVASYLQDCQVETLDISKPIGRPLPKFNLTLPTEIMEQLIDAAAKDGRSVSSWVRQACVEKLDRDTANQPEQEEAAA